MDANGARIELHLLTADGVYLNNPELPLLVYSNALNLQAVRDKEMLITELFKKNGWTKSWVDGVYDYHHYHSNAHEVLGISAGECTLQLGGSDGMIETLKAGDVLIIPAGVVHKRSDCSPDFTCVGAYADDRSYDMNYCKVEEKERALKNIREVPIPAADPVYGTDGPLKDYWVQ